MRNLPSLWDLLVASVAVNGNKRNKAMIFEKCKISQLKNK